ncbi:MAG: ABC transporter permease [Acidimicrobiales bacterium]
MNVALEVDRTRATRRSVRHALGRAIHLREVQLLVAIGVVVAASTAAQPAFIQPGNISFMLADASATAILSIGQTVVVLARGIDLSVAPILGIAAVLVAFPAQDLNMPIIAGLGIVLAVGLVLGAANGLLVSVARIPPIIATLATLSVYGGLQFIFAKGEEISNIPNAYGNLGNNDIVSGIPWVVLITAVLAIVVAFFLRSTNVGRSIYAVGNDAAAAHRSGIPVQRIIFVTYVISGVLAGIGGLIYLCHVGSVDSTTGSDSNVNLLSIAATLIGGTALTGGRGGVFGSVLGAVFLSVALTAMVFARIPSIWEPAGVGVLMLLAMLSDRRAGAPARRARHRTVGSA